MLTENFEQLRIRLAGSDAVLILAVLGILVGLSAGTVNIAFRYAIEWGQALFLPTGQHENYEALSAWSRIILTTLGGLICGIIVSWGNKDKMTLGVIHVMERLQYHQGHLPLRAAAQQFLGGAVSIICGHSVGREGPSIHLGAATASQLARALALPNNSVRLLVGAGIAAAIGASFNTPLAGVIFAIEVVMIEYTVSSMVPIILASVTATSLTRAVYGSQPAFSIPEMSQILLGELPFVIVAGLLIGLISVAMIINFRFCTQLFTNLSILQRCTIGGLGVGLLGTSFPEVMGIGYDTVNRALWGEVGLIALTSIAAAKLIASTFCIAMRLPGGIIGPTFVVGATACGAYGTLLFNNGFTVESEISLYVLLGMGAMMGATLNAPLAALIALLELTANPNIILPGMLAIVSANLITSGVFKQPSLFVMMLQNAGFDYRQDPVLQAMRAVGVGKVMNRDIAVTEAHLNSEELQKIKIKKPRWLIVTKERMPISIMPFVGLLRYSEEHSDVDTIDLMEIPADRFQPAEVNLLATLQEAWDILSTGTAEMLFVSRVTVPGITNYYGVLTREDVETGYRK